MKKKTVKSRYNYVHYTKKYVTIGRKGYKQKKIKHEKIIKEIEKVNKKLKEYSTKYYGKNDDFPRDIGMESNKNRFTINVIDFLNEIKNSPERVKNIPIDIFNKYQKIANMAKDEKYFEDEFFGAVSKSYGYEISTEQTKKILEEKGFMISAEMGEFYNYDNPAYVDKFKTPSDTSRLISWMVSNIDELKDKNILKDGEKSNFDKIYENVKNINYLRKVVQDYDVFGTVDDYILNIVKDGSGRK